MANFALSKIDNPLFGKIFVITLSIGLSLIMFLHFQNPRSDFRLFYDAAQELLDGSSPWLRSTHPPDQVFLNGAATLSILSLFTVLKFESAISLLRFLMITTALLFVYRFGKGTDIKFKVALVFFTLTSIPLRANLEYGALGFLMFFAWFFALSNQKKYSDIILGVVLAVTLDFKPQLFWVNLFILLTISLRGKIAFVLTLILPWTIMSVLLGRFLIRDWVEVVIQRSELAQSDNQQMDIACILRLLGLGKGTSFLLFAIFTSAFLLYLVKTKKLIFALKNPLILMGISVAFNVFLHPTDLSVYLPFLVILLRKVSDLGRYNIVLVTLSISLMSVWSNDLKFALIASLINGTLVVALKADLNMKNLSVLTMIFCIPFLFALFSEKSQTLEHFLRNSMNYFGFLIALLALIFWKKRWKLSELQNAKI
jgi:hypothetical protein